MRKRVISITLALVMAFGNPISMTQTEAALIQDEPNDRESKKEVATGTLETQNPITTKNSGLTKEQIMDKFVADYIKDGMSTVEKLDKIGEFVANYSHPGSQNVDIEMIKGGILVSGYGDCVQTAGLIEQLAKKLGYEVRTRDASADAGASRSHVTALVYDGDHTYQVSASEGPGWNGRWFVLDLGSGYEYTAYNEGEIIFKQYSGNKTEININEGLKDWAARPGDCVTTIQSGALFRSRGRVKKIIVPASVNKIYDLYIGRGAYTFIFEGDAPEFVEDYTFQDMIVTAYYPKGNNTWTESVMKQYQGTVSWIPYEGKSEDIDISKDNNVPPKSDENDEYTGDTDSSTKNESIIFFDNDTVTKRYGNGRFKIPLNVTGNGLITYSSTDPSVATVDQNGTVTIKNTGKTRIVASISETDEYKSDTNYYELTVKKGTPAVTGTSKYTYTGKSIKPKVTVKAGGKKWKSSAYSISYKNNKEPGKATVIIKPKDKNYRNVTWSFSIAPSKVKSLSLKTKKGKLTVTYKKVKGKISGYQISYRKKGQKSWKTKNVSSKKNSTTLTVSRRKTYEVKVRAYKKSGNSKIYGAYSNLKKLKVK